MPIHYNPALLRTRSNRLEPAPPAKADGAPAESAGQTESGPEPCDLLGQTIDHGRLKLVAKLGQGGFGTVYRAEDQCYASSSSSTGVKQYAVKVMKKAEYGSQRWVYQMRELAAHRMLSSHPNIVTLHEVTEDDDFYYMVMDYCTGGDLFRTVVDKQKLAGQTERIKRLFVQLLDAVEVCHEMGIAHRDLKPDNVFCRTGDSDHIVLGDFGMCTWILTSTSYRCGSAPYMSPECYGELYEYRPYSALKSDIWSLGVILMNMITGFNPWGSATTGDRSFRRYLHNPDSFRNTLPISKEANKILQSIFTLDTRQRITIPELRERVLGLETFFMSKKDIARGSDILRQAARFYRPLPRICPIYVEERRRFAEAAARRVHFPEARPENGRRVRFVESDDDPIVTVTVLSADNTTPDSVPSLSDATTLSSSSCETRDAGLSPEASAQNVQTAPCKAPHLEGSQGVGVVGGNSKGLPASSSVRSLVGRFKSVLRM